MKKKARNRQMRHKPKRKCVGCQQIKDKSELLRIVRGRQKELTLAKLPGRGAYLCRNMDCLAAARKKKGLERSFKQAVSAEVYEAMKIEVTNAQNSSI